MMSGDFRREEVEEYDGDDSGLELSLGLSIGGRNSFFVEKRAAATEAQGPAGEVAGDSRWVFPQPRAAAAATLSRTVSGPPDAAEVRRRREMHAIKRQEARRKLEEKQIRKGGGGSGTAARGGGGRSSGGGGLWRTCSAGDRSAMEVHGQRGTVRDRNAADDYAHHRRKVGPKIDDLRSPTTSGAAGGGCATPPASNSLSGSTATPTASQIPPENSSSSNRKPNDDHDGGEPHPSAPYRTNPSNPTTPYPFPPMMPMPFPLHPAQYVHFTAGGPGFPYVMPCWNPQVPPDGNRSVPLQQQQPAAVVTPQPGRGSSSSFRPFRQQASGNVERGRSAEVNSSKPRTAATTARGMKRVPSLTGSQGSSFSAISDYRSDLDPNQGGSGSRGCGGDNTEPRADSPDRPAASGPTTMPGRSSPSRSINTSPAPSDHSVSSNPTAKADHKQQTPPSTGQPRQQKEPHPEPPASAADGMPEQATAAGPRPAVAAANTATTASTTNRRPAPRTMPYVCAKGTGPDGRTVTGFLYKFDDKDKVSIVCVCHGSSFTPAEFVRHAGATDVDNPLRHIVMIEEPPEHRVMVPSAS